VALPANWKQWVLKALLSGTPAMQILKTLLENGFLFEDAKAVLGSNLPSTVSSPLNAEFFKALAKPRFALENVEVHGNDTIQLYAIPHFLDDAVCQQVIDVAQNHFEPSTIAAKKGFESHRTSTTCQLTFLNDAVIGDVEQKIVSLLKLGIGENEVMQAQRYEVGQEFKQHTDYFEPGTEAYRQHAAKRGQRTWTCMIYLNDVIEGGETEFVTLQKCFTPQKGTALIWNNLLPSGTPNPMTLHHAHPVIKGKKFVITKWFRTFNQ